MKRRFPETPEMARIYKSATLRNRLDREPRISEQRSGKLESQPLLILQWSQTSCRFESAHQITRTHVGELGQTRQAHRLGKVRAQPILDPMNTRMQVVSKREINAGLIVTAMSS